MKRSTPLKRGASQLKRTPLNRVSKKHAKELKVYSALRLDYLARHPACEVGVILGNSNCTLYSHEIHHAKKRGPMLNEVAYFRATCQSCHQFIHAHPSIARKHELL